MQVGKTLVTGIRKVYEIPNGTLSCIHFNAEAGPIRLVFAHANGFNAESYTALLTGLKVHAVAIDMRGHGFTELPTDIGNLHNFEIFGDDIAEFVERYTIGKVVLSGHSMGATSAILASPRLQERLAGYVGFDPVTLPPRVRFLAKSKLGRALMKRYFPLANNAGKRRRVFKDHNEAFTRYQGRGVFSKIPDETLHDYLSGGLRPSTQGVELACDPLWEQAIYCAQDNDYLRAAQSLPANTAIHYAGMHPVSTVKSRSKIARVIGEEKITFQPNFYHMFPFHNHPYAISALSNCIECAD